MGWFKKDRRAEIQTFRYRADADRKNMMMFTDTGCVRDNNEDAVALKMPRSEKLLMEKGILMMLADGMGGHSSGEVASELALEIFAHQYYNSRTGILQSLKKAFARTNREVFGASLTDRRLQGMGTTFTTLVVLGEVLYLVHIGDSRCYIFRNGILDQLSHDHTMVQQMVDEGVIPRGEARHHPERNVLLKALGTQVRVEADIMRLDQLFSEECLILLCSDGLYDLLDDQEIASVLSGCDTLDDMGNSLIREARTRGGYDNITLLLASSCEAHAARPLKDTLDIPILRTQ